MASVKLPHGGRVVQSGMMMMLQHRAVHRQRDGAEELTRFQMVKDQSPCTPGPTGIS
jgi:hypothetical protein